LLRSTESGYTVALSRRGEPAEPPQPIHCRFKYTKIACTMSSNTAVINPLIMTHSVKSLQGRMGLGVAKIIKLQLGIEVRNASKVRRKGPRYMCVCVCVCVCVYGRMATFEYLTFSISSLFSCEMNPSTMRDSLNNTSVNIAVIFLYLSNEFLPMCAYKENLELDLH